MNMGVPFRVLPGRMTFADSHADDDTHRPDAVPAHGTPDTPPDAARRVDRLRAVSERAGLGLWEFDAAAGTLHGDAGLARRLGLAPGEAAFDPRRWTDRLHPADRLAVESGVQDALAHGSALDAEWRLVRRDGTLLHLEVTAEPERDADGRVRRLLGTYRDVTPLRELAHRAAEEHELLRVTLESIGDAVITTDAAARVTALNPAAERMTGWTRAEATGRPLSQVFHVLDEPTRRPAQNPVHACLAQGRVIAPPDQTLLISRNGQEFGIEDSATPIRDARGACLGAVLVFRDATEQRRLSGEVSYRAKHDALTGLVNRSEFELRLQRTLARAQAEHSVHALLYIDLDQFKLVNEACGHAAGDQLLQQVGKLLSEAARSRDTLARLGGDEFAIILEHCSVAQARRVAQQVCERLDDFRFVHDGQRFRIGSSIGLVPVDARWQSSTAVMQAADSACYAAKEGGRNRVHVWFDTDAAIRARQDEMQWATRLERALDDDRFELFAQRIEPLAGADAGLHAELLIRLPDGAGGYLSPAVFVPAAERFQLAPRLDRWVLERALRLLARPEQATRLALLAVNLSGKSVGDRDFHRQVLAALDGAGAAACRRLCLEITETAAVTNLDAAAAFIGELRARGVRVALDDFGAGASSFGYLKSMKVDLLKIDGQFIRNLVDDPLDTAAVRAFVEVAGLLGLQTVAECVETPAILERARAMGIDHVQGYLLHRPEPVERLLASALLPA
jgi:diguanylate cyclase (GGDEF)-like protein/PAS domain S-box-containing protein